MVPLHSQEAFARPNAHCMRGEIVGLTGTSVVVEDAITKTRKEQPADVVVFATGYRESLEIFGELFLSMPMLEQKHQEKSDWQDQEYGPHTLKESYICNIRGFDC